MYYAILCIKQYKSCAMHYALCTMHYALFIMHYALCKVQYALCSIYYTYICTIQLHKVPLKAKNGESIAYYIIEERQDKKD